MKANISKAQKTYQDNILPLHLSNKQEIKAKNSQNYLTGLKGEKIATAYLKANEYNIIESRYKKFSYEIDIICTKNNSIFFIEVKTSNCTDANLYLSSQQLYKYHLLAEHYIATNEQYNQFTLHFDAIIISKGNIKYIKDIVI